MKPSHQFPLPSDDHTRNEFQELLLSLPKTEGWTDTLVEYQGYWFLTRTFRNILFLQKHFQAHHQDIILASMPKSGTTWLKSLVFSIVSRSTYSFSDTPLLSTNPHGLVPFIEHIDPKLTNISINPTISPRLFSTHVPYSFLPDSIKNSNCRVVYICRNPLDTIVSFWHFATRVHQKWSVDEYAERFCKGKVGFGPFWDHILGYWKESLENPEKVLFLKYEELKDDTVSQVKRLAEFLGFPFTLEEENQGVVDEIIKVCSLKNLKELEVNKNGKSHRLFANESLFRKGEVGDWVNHLSSFIVENINKVIEEKFSDSGLTVKTAS